MKIALTEVNFKNIIFINFLIHSESIDLYITNTMGLYLKGMFDEKVNGIHFIRKNVKTSSLIEINKGFFLSEELFKKYKNYYDDDFLLKFLSKITPQMELNIKENL